MNWVEQLRIFLAASWVYHQLAYDLPEADGGVSREAAVKNFQFLDDVADALASTPKADNRCCPRYTFPGASSQWALYLHATPTTTKSEPSAGAAKPQGLESK